MNIRNYALLALMRGVNVQKGQTLVISAPLWTADFAHMLMAGDGGMQFWLGTHFEPTDAATATMSYLLPDNGWYRITLRGLVLVRDAKEGEEAQWNLVTESLDEGAVYALFYKE